MNSHKPHVSCVRLFFLYNDHSMLVLVDESGDPGRKFNAGSSRFFAVTAILFKDFQEANRCDAAIDRLRTKLSISPRKEFHFSKDNDEFKTAFLMEINQYDFSFTTTILDKIHLRGPNFEVKNSLYTYTVRLTFQNIESQLENAIVNFDKCGGREFTRQLRNYLRKRQDEWSEEDGRRRIKKVKAERSDRNNLIQMADMVSGAVFRSFSDRKNRLKYRQIIRSKENCVLLWPPE